MKRYLKEENSELKGRRFPLGDGIRKHLLSVLRSYDGNKDMEGYKRLNNILASDKGITYQDMKRIKNFFDTYNGSPKSDEYRLNGGEAMRWWVENSLGTARKRIKYYKQAKKDAGVSNAFIRPHEKDRQRRKNRPTGVKYHISNKNSLENKTLRYENQNKNTMKRRINESIDTNYTHYAVNKETGLIVNGWDYHEYDPADLRNDKRYFFIDDLEDYGFNPKEYTILTRKSLLKRGIDPDNEQESWSNDGLVSLSDGNRQNESKRSLRRIIENAVRRALS